ncbi:MAG: NUDIX hydrolase domain-like protein [Benniella sp.]|nr:MAG: NUDIX hydrolase domain-like protein [Benniella sp.]
MNAHTTTFAMATDSVQPRWTLLDIVNQCDSFPYAPDPRLDQLSFLDFVVDDIPVGRIHSSLVPHLTAFNQNVRPVFDITGRSVSFMPWLSDYDSRSGAIAQMLNEWRTDLNNFSCLSGWRDELYGVYTHINDPATTKGGAALAIERSACGLFGVHAYGVHLNGFVRTGPKPWDVQLWIARRSLTKPTYPGLLDNMVAGGMGFGHSPKYTVIKECMEEATVPADIAVNAIPVGTISYTKLSKNAKETQPETQIVYDLELPKDFTPTPCDTEVESFRLWSMDQVINAIRQGEFKPNCACVCIHFMIRHAVLTPENEPDYLDIVHRLHRRVEYPGPKVWPTFLEAP